MKIRVTFDPRPNFGTPNYDYRAIDEDTYDVAPDGPLHPVGYGATAREAVIDLLDQLEEHVPAARLVEFNPDRPF